MRRKLVIVAFTWFLVAGMAAAAAAAAPPAATQPATPSSLAPGWEEIDQRLIFFTVELASVETSLNAVNKALHLSGYQQSTRRTQVERAQQGNEAMDRNGGGPVGWQEFYGKTAERFFYHPDIEVSVVKLGAGQLSRSSPSDPSQQNLPGPASLRPPQFDYIYRANENAQRRAEAEVEKLAGHIDALLGRRRQLEAEQAAAWAKIAFQAVASRKLASKPLYRFDLKVAGADDVAKQRQEAIRAAAAFVRTVVRAMADAQDVVDKDPGATFDALRDTVGAAAAQLDDRLIRSPKLALDASDTSTPLGRLVASADRMADVAKNIADSYRGSRQGDQTQDDQRKQTFRAFAQQALFDSASNVYTTSDCVVAISRDWHVEIDPLSPMATTAPSAFANIAKRPETTRDEAGAKTPDTSDGSAEAATTDAERPIVKDGWTILFRAQDPLAWNFPIRSKDIYAVPMSSAPPHFRYLRMRRLDTQEQVIIETGAFKANPWPSHDIYFRGDKPVDRAGCALGIIDVRQPVDRNRSPIIDMTPGGDFSGWGFGEWPNAAGQGYVWNGQKLGPTAFEVAVTDRALTPDERKVLVKQ